MRRHILTARDFARSPRGKKAIRYTIVSGISVAVAVSSAFVLLYFFSMDAQPANIISSMIGAIPSYYLNRRWAWGKRGRSHLMKEILPFWGIAIVGLVFSTVVADWTEEIAERATDVHLLQSLIVVTGIIGAYGLLWVGKFIFFNRVLFAHREPPAGPAAESA